MKAEKRLLPTSYKMIGWRENIALPELGVAEMRAKIDTGARTSAIHAVDQTLFEKDGRKWVKFRVPASQFHRSVYLEVPVHDQRPIKNTSGVPEVRTVIEVLMRLGDRSWRIELSLANRANMGFDIILGRTAIRRRRLLVNPGRSFLMGAPVDVQNQTTASQ